MDSWFIRPARAPLLVATLFLTGTLAPRLALAEVIYLSGGQVIEASVLKETPERVIVDLGFEVVSIPRAQISRMQAARAEAATSQSTRSSEHLYSTADLPVRNVKELSQRFGEAVVLVASPSGQGSGFFISAEGHVITNFHVVEGETRLSVAVFRRVGDEFRREKFENVEIVATNPFLDLALLKVALPEGYRPTLAYLDDDDDLRDGDTVFAIGNPLGLERSVSEGIVSRRNRAEAGLAYVQTTTQINPGNSGGPLFNGRGEVVGVTNMKLMGAEGLGFAIPVRYVIDFLRNRDAFAYNSESSEAGFRYLQPPARLETDQPSPLAAP